MDWLFISKLPKEGAKGTADQIAIRDLVYSFCSQREGGALRSDADLISSFIDWVKYLPETEKRSYDVPKLSPSHHAERDATAEA